MRGIDIRLPFVTSKLSSTEHLTHRPGAAMLIPESDMGPTNDKGQSCEAVTYRKKPVFLQLANLTKHFSSSPKASLTAVWRLIEPKMKNFTSRAFVASDVYFFA
ncbi:hypothetical protein [Pseudomonas syringae]|uniref:hypothetical protein n=1 Tax=Pseudomonas syringae TaxID=317 RepID=UPI001CA84D23|nr:hypothetical protein [Pseudomonas syringae]